MCQCRHFFVREGNPGMSADFTVFRVFTLSIRH